MTIVLSMLALFNQSDSERTTARQGGDVKPALTTDVGTRASLRYSVWRVLTGTLQSARAITALIVFAGIISIGVATGAPVEYSARLALGVALAAMSSFALNDYYDQERDVVNAPQRAIPSGKLSEKEALFASLLFFLCAVIIGAHGLSPLALLIFLVGCTGGFAYNEAGETVACRQRAGHGLPLQPHPHL